MNKQSRLAPAAGSVPPLVEPAATFSYRTAPCPAHDTATATSCDECVRGEVDCQCADCLQIAPLNDDGVCEFCADSSELPLAAFNAKWLCPHVRRLPNGWGRVEL